MYATNYNVQEPKGAVSEQLQVLRNRNYLLRIQFQLRKSFVSSSGSGSGSGTVMHSGFGSAKANSYGFCGSGYGSGSTTPLRGKGKKI